MRVLFVLEQYAAEGSRYYREFFRQLDKRGAGVVVVNLNRSDAFRDDISELVEGFHSLDLTSGYHRSVGSLKRIFRTEAPSVVQGMEIIPSFYSAIALATLPGGRPPLVYGRRHGPTEGKVARLMDWVAFAGAKRVIAVSKAMAEVARKEHPFGKNKVGFIRSGVTLDQGRESTEGERSVLATLGEGQDFKVLLLARLRPEKGHVVALQAAEILKREGIAVRLLFVGEGQEQEGLEKEAEERDLTSEVFFTGHLEGIKPVLDLSDVMIIPSFADAFPKVAVEAFAAGVPVVASAVGGLTELIIPGETGLLVEPGDAHALADALATLQRDPEKARRLASNARETYRRELTPEIMAERYFSEYQRLVEGV